MNFNNERFGSTQARLLLCTTFMLALPEFVAAQVPAQLVTQPILQPSSIKQAGPNGGSLISVEDLKIETVIRDSGIRVFAFDIDGQLVNMQQARGLALVKVASGPKSYRYDLLPDEQGALAANFNQTRTTGKQIEIEVQLVGVPQMRGRKIQLRDLIAIPPSAHQIAASAIARQKVCPVTGRPLGSMGEPLPVRVGERTVFVCSSGCIAAVNNDPAKYAGGKPSILVTTATEEDAQLIAKQARCPVMDESLGSMGQPIKVMVGDKPIYLCCKGCVKKIKQEPGKYVAMVYGEESLTEDANNSQTHAVESSATTPPTQVVPAGTDAVRPGVFKVTGADTPFIAAQKRCPVMDEPLDAMGGPLKVHADGRAIYICCPGCAKRIAAEPQKYIAILNQQGTNAPRIQ